MKKVYIFIVIIGVVFVAIGTNPDQAKHKKAFKKSMNELVLMSFIKNNKSENINESIGLVLGTSIFAAFLNNMVSSKNYILFSTTEITWEGKKMTIGIGLFGKVYISSKVREILAQKTPGKFQNFIKNYSQITL